MRETGYQISEMAKLLETEPHVLRYWEEELNLEVPRNEMGHRFYTEKNMEEFRKIIALKQQGFQLRTIREIMRIEDEEIRTAAAPSAAGGGTQEKVLREDGGMKPEKTRKEDGGGQASGKDTGKEQKSYPDGVSERKRTRQQEVQEAQDSSQAQFARIMERLIREIALDERREGRSRRLDEAIRRHQQLRRMTAAAGESGRADRAMEKKKKKRKKR